MTAWIQRVARQFVQIYTQRIWQAAVDDDRSVRGHFFAVLRVISITLTGLDEISVLSRAAALSYSTLLGIGPLIGIGVMVAGAVLQNSDTNLAVDSLNRLLHAVAPQLSELERTSAAAGGPATAGVNERLVELLNNFIQGSRSGTLGVAGALMLVVIVIQLFISVEESFNSIWGVRRGRSLLIRIGLYWTLVTLGAVLALAALSLLSAVTFAPLFEHLPWGRAILAAFRWSGPLAAFAVLVVVLTLFYRYIPNTNVRWPPALVGAAIVVGLLFLNNYLAFFYVKSVLRSQSLFGSLSLVPVLMIGLYIFWLFVLLGGQVTYAIQNVHYRSSRIAWDNLSQHSREALSLLVLVLIARRFKQCLPSFTASQLSAAIRVPTQVLNESLNRLLDLRLIASSPPASGESALDYHYQPARPLARITLREFRESFAQLGSSPAGDRLDLVDPVLRFYQERLAAGRREALGDHSLDTLIEELPPAPRESSA